MEQYIKIMIVCNELTIFKILCSHVGIGNSDVIDFVRWEWYEYLIK